jgi:hypothetical protein
MFGSGRRVAVLRGENTHWRANARSERVGGAFNGSDAAAQLGMIDLNVRKLVELTHSYWSAILTVSGGVRARDRDHVSRQCETREKNRPNLEEIRERSSDRLSGSSSRRV